MRSFMFGVVLFWAACAPPQLSLPAGATCAKSIAAGPGAESLIDALAGAQRGTCVVAAAGKYQGEFSVPAGVTLGAEAGVLAQLVGTRADLPAVTLGSGATLTGMSVIDAPGVGVSGGPGAQLLSVSIERAGSAGAVFWCEEDCRVGEPSGMREVLLTENAVGLLVHGARVNVVGGKVSKSKSLTLASGYGVVASHGAELQLTGTQVEDNEDLGLLVDGAQDSSASLNAVTIKNNKGRGIWAQGLLGTSGSPRLQLDACVVEGNRLVGVGARNSRGVRIQGGRIASTVMGQATLGPGVLVGVGDGIGLFESTGDVHVEAVTIENNARTQVVIDTGAAGLALQNTTVTSGAGQLGVIVQRTSVTVEAPMMTTPMPGRELPISAPLLAVPTR